MIIMISIHPLAIIIDEMKKADCCENHGETVVGSSAGAGAVVESEEM